MFTRKINPMVKIDEGTPTSFKQNPFIEQPPSISSTVPLLSIQPYNYILRWFTTVFCRLISTGYDCLPDVSTNCACKNDESDPKQKREPRQHLKGIKSLWAKKL